MATVTLAPRVKQPLTQMNRSISTTSFGESVAVLYMAYVVLALLKSDDWVLLIYECSSTAAREPIIFRKLALRACPMSEVLVISYHVCSTRAHPSPKIAL
jgi:hypothetical protein